MPKNATKIKREITDDQLQVISTFFSNKTDGAYLSEKIEDDLHKNINDYICFQEEGEGDEEFEARCENTIFNNIKGLPGIYLEPTKTVYFPKIVQINTAESYESLYQPSTPNLSPLPEEAPENTPTAGELAPLGIID